MHNRHDRVDQPLRNTGGLASCPRTLCHMDLIKTATFQLAGNLLCLLSYSCTFNKTYDTFVMNFFGDDKLDLESWKWK